MKSVTRILITALVLTGIGFIPLPYELETVRPALNAKDFVQVQGGTDKGKGKIYVMAVGVSKARVFSLFLTLLPNYRLETEYVSVPENYFDKEKGREERENSTMGSSHLNALQVAYQAAGRTVEIRHKEIYVGGISSETPLSKELQRGDVILKIDNQTYTSPYDIVDQMEQRPVGDVVSIEYSRNGVIGLASGPVIVDETTGKPGLGIELGSKASVAMNPLTEMKVMAADKAGAEIFFVPDDTIDADIAQYNPKLRSNYHEALRASIKIKSKMKIVPVKTFNEALNYLREME